MPLSIPGLNYPVNGGLPSGVIPECQGALWSALLLDGHLSHLSNKVRELCRKHLGFAVNWGPVGHFERRPNVERLFRTVEDRLFKRLPSTTGAKPGKGRAKDAEGAAVRYEIDAEENEQLLDVTMAQFNGMQTEGLSFMSPLEYIRYHIEQRGNHFMVRHLPAARRALKDAIPSKITCVVRGGREQGRRPHIQLDRAHYTNPVLADSGHLIGQQLIVEINEDDYRSVRAYLGNGAEIGILTAQGRWGKTKHSRTTRKLINRLVTQRIITLSEYDDPVQVYMNYVSTPKATKSKKDKRPLTPKDATDAVRVAKESRLPLAVGTPLDPARTKGTSQQTTGRPSALGRPLPDLKGLLNRSK